MGYTYEEYLIATASCEICGWTGKAKDLAYGEYYPESHICDLDCPRCREHVGFVSFPIGYAPEQ